MSQGFDGVPHADFHLAQVLRKLGVTPDSKRTFMRGPASQPGVADSASKQATQQEPTCSREVALAHAEAAFQGFKLPHELLGGVTVTRWDSDTP